MTRPALTLVPLVAALLCPALTGCGDDDRPADGGSTVGDAGPDASTDAGPAGCIPASMECTTPGGDECCAGYVCRATSSRAFCVEPDDVCFVGAADGCCLDDADCADGLGCVAMECRPDGDGVCEPPPTGGECWTDADCAAGETCNGVTLCPCGAMCDAADAPGTCA